VVSRLISHIRHNLVAYTALFFALGGGAMAASTQIRSTDTIPEGDLAGSTYGNPLIGSGKETNGKLANSSLTVSSGTGLTGGGSVSLGGSTTLGVADGGINTTQLHDGAVTTSKFDSGAKAPDAAKLDGASPSGYGAVMSGRINGIPDSPITEYGAASGTSTASMTEADVSTLSPDHALKARDFSVQLTAAPGGTVFSRTFSLVINGNAGFSCQIQTSATTCTDSGPVDVPANSTLSIRSVPFVSPEATDARFAFRLTNQ